MSVIYHALDVDLQLHLFIPPLYSGLSIYFNPLFSSGLVFC